MKVVRHLSNSCPGYLVRMRYTEDDQAVATGEKTRAAVPCSEGLLAAAAKWAEKMQANPRSPYAVRTATHAHLRPLQLGQCAVTFETRINGKAMGAREVTS